MLGRDRTRRVAIIALAQFALLAAFAWAFYFSGGDGSNDPLSNLPWAAWHLPCSGLPAEHIAPVGAEAPGLSDQLLVQGKDDLSLIQLDSRALRFVFQRARTAGDRLLFPEVRTPRGWWVQRRTDRHALYVGVESDIPGARREFGSLSGVDLDGNGACELGATPVAVYPTSKPEILILGLTNGRDQHPRGLQACSYDTGDSLWRYEMASDPQSVVLEDVAGDEAPELFVSGWSPDNGAVVGGLSDSTCTLASLTLAGQTRWVRSAGPRFAESVCRVGGVLREGRQVVWLISSQADEEEPSTWLSVRDAQTGESIRDQVFPGQCPSFVLCDLDDDGIEEIITGFSDGGLMAMDGELRRHVPRRQFDARVHVTECVDLDGDQRPEIVARLGTGIGVFGRDLRLLARMELHDATSFRMAFYRPSNFCVLRVQNGRSLIAATDQGRLTAAYFRPRSRRAPDVGSPWWLLALVLLIQTAFVFASTRILTTPVAPSVSEPRAEGPAIDRVKLLVRRLDDLFHANPTFRGPTGALQNLLLATALWDQAAPRDTPDEQVAIGVAKRYVEYHSRDAAQLAEDFADCAASFPEIAEAVASEDLLRRALPCIISPGAAVERTGAVPEQVGEHARRLNRALRAVDLAARGYLSCDLAQEVRVVLGDLGEAIESALADVTLVVRCRRPHRLRALCHPVELRPIVANLVVNALRATALREQPEVAVTIGECNGLLRLEVHDNGIGISQEGWNRLFTEGPESGEGGRGLVRARRVLEEYGARLELVTSDYGTGAAVRIEFARL